MVWARRGGGLRGGMLLCDVGYCIHLWASRSVGLWAFLFRLLDF